MKKLTSIALIVLLFFVTEAACQRTPATSYTKQYGIGTYGPSGEQPVNYVGSVDPGDSLVYNHPNGRYIDTFRYACGDAGGYMLVNGRRINTPNTGGGLKWVSVVDTINITDGRLIIKFQARRVNLLWVAVGPSPLPAPPGAFAGGDAIIYYPQDTIRLVAQVRGTGTNYSWRELQPGANGALVGEVAYGLYKAVYGYELTVTDQYGRVAKDTINVYAKWLWNDIFTGFSLGVAGTITVLNNQQVVFKQ